ncbi:MAG: hypothetical protein KAT86_05095 [Candidatus Latescibacteria bacterium]|nr:hypothetical protein [Candidatus Latescibacterota bacterium]
MFEKNRSRRVIYNDDGDQVYSGYEGYGYHITDEESFLEARTTPTFGTHVDTYVWCVGNGADPPWGILHGDKVWPWLGTFERGTDIIVEACHAQGMEVWGSLRMNDLHDSFMADRLEDAAVPIKAEHPEYLIAPEQNRHLPDHLSERYLWTALNFALPEVRDYRLRFIEKNASAHDFDGYELDFTRFIWDFPLGEERKHAHLMTDFVRKVRELLDTIGKQRGRPYTLVVHVPDSPSVSLDLGFDVKAWLEEELVDVLVVGMGYVVYDMKLGEWQELGRQYDIPVYPSLNINGFGRTWTDLHNKPVYHEAARAISAYWQQEGIEGLYLFNLFCLEDKNVAGLPMEYIYAPLHEIGDSTTMERKDKLYAIQPTSDRGFCQHGSEATPLPIALDIKEYEMSLFMGPDANDPQASIEIRALTRGGNENTKVWFRLNHTLLEPEKKDDWYIAEVPKGAILSGDNKLAIWCNIELTEAKNPVIVQRVFVPVSYG